MAPPSDHAPAALMQGHKKAFLNDPELLRQALAAFLPEPRDLDRAQATALASERS